MTRSGIRSATPVGLPVGDPVGVTVPVQVTPLRVNEVGTGLDPDQVPLNPGMTVAPVPSVPLYDMLATVTTLPDWLNAPFQPESTCCPAVKDHFSVQELSGSPRLVTDTLAPKPGFHWLVTV